MAGKLSRNTGRKIVVCACAIPTGASHYTDGKDFASGMTMVHRPEHSKRKI